MAHETIALTTELRELLRWPETKIYCNVGRTTSLAKKAPLFAGADPTPELASSRRNSAADILRFEIDGVPWLTPTEGCGRRTQARDSPRTMAVNRGPPSPPPLAEGVKRAMPEVRARRASGVGPPSARWLRDRTCAMGRTSCLLIHRALPCRGRLYCARGRGPARIRCQAIEQVPSSAQWLRDRTCGMGRTSCLLIQRALPCRGRLYCAALCHADIGARRASSVGPSTICHEADLKRSTAEDRRGQPLRRKEIV